MADTTGSVIFGRMLDAMRRMDMHAMADLLHPDFVEEYPQSGERIKGAANLVVMLERYPGGLGGAGAVDNETARLVDDEERWALTPGYTVVKLAQPGSYTAIVRVAYPDGSWWHLISMFEVRDERIARRTMYFAPEFEPPEWRKDLVERIDRSAAEDSS